jgi:hypothetical protein
MTKTCPEISLAISTLGGAILSGVSDDGRVYISTCDRDTAERLLRSTGYRMYDRTYHPYTHLPHAGKWIYRWRRARSRSSNTARST